jgi:MFS family permease
VKLATPLEPAAEIRATTRRPSRTAQLFPFLHRYSTAVLLVSALILIPCFWQRRIEAGDLGSHTYIAWLAVLVQQGRAPGLFLAPQWNNIPVDFCLSWLGPRIGFAAADRIVVSACVLTFFWGAFAFIAASTRRIPWTIVPAIAMVAYGFTFYAGFMNFYLSLGLAFLAVAITWRAAPVDWLVGAIFSALSLVAHPMGFGLLVALFLYIHVAELFTTSWRWLVFGAALFCVIAIHFALPHFFHVEGWSGTKVLAMNGADQMVLFRPAYRYLALATFVFGCFAFVAAARADRRHRQDLAERVRTPLELWVILLIAATMVPAAVWLPEYTAAVSAISSRITTLTAILGLCVLGAVLPRRWILAGLSAIALVFFAMQFHDTAVLNVMERRVETLVAGLPYGSKVSYTIDIGDFSRINSRHFVDRACIGHCFTYSNYEPGSKQFRVRLSPQGSSIISSSGFALEHGTYVVREYDLPLYQIYQPDDADLTKLAIRGLAAGEMNGRIGHHQPVE